MTTENNHKTKLEKEREIWLCELLNSPVLLHGQKIGSLSDLVIIDRGEFAEVTHLYVTRSFGAPALLIPTEKAAILPDREISLHVDSLQPYEGSPADDAVLLRDHILDKKVLDTEDREVEVVYDIRLDIINKKLFVSSVDLSRYGFLRRLHLGWLAN